MPRLTQAMRAAKRRATKSVKDLNQGSGSVQDQLMRGGTSYKHSGYNFEDVPRMTPGQASAASYNPNGSKVGLVSTAAQMGRMMGGNLKSQFGDGWGIAKAAGRHMAKGAVAGAAIEGTSEWAQGGSFWTGAKAGAFDGAVGWGAYRMAGRAVGATSRNPFKADGLLPQASKMSKQARAILQGKAGAAAAKNLNGLG